MTASPPQLLSRSDAAGVTKRDREGERDSEGERDREGEGDREGERETEREK